MPALDAVGVVAGAADQVIADPVTAVEQVVAFVSKNNVFPISTKNPVIAFPCIYGFDPCKRLVVFVLAIAIQLIVAITPLN